MFLCLRPRIINSFAEHTYTRITHTQWLNGFFYRIAIPQRFLRPEGRLHRSVECEKLSSSEEFLNAERPDSIASNSSLSSIRRQDTCTKFGDLALVAVFSYSYFYVFFYCSLHSTLFLSCSSLQHLNSPVSPRASGRGSAASVSRSPRSTAFRRVEHAHSKVVAPSFLNVHASNF